MCLFRKQASLWMQGDLYRAKQKEMERTRDRLEVSSILHGVDGISIHDNKLLSMSMQNDSDLEDDVEVSFIVHFMIHYICYVNFFALKCYYVNSLIIICLIADGYYSRR